MDERLRAAIEYADHYRSIKIQRQIFKEKLEADLTFGYNGGIFKVDQSLIAFTQCLLDNGRNTDVPLIDSNGTPILIADLTVFQIDILDRYFSATQYYLSAVEKLKSLKLEYGLSAL
jgi:hypothetical protein